jgi:hypothetical protein
LHISVKKQNKIRENKIPLFFPESYYCRVKHLQTVIASLQQQHFFVCFSATASVAKILNAKTVTAQTQCQTDQVLKYVFFFFFF